MPTVNTEDFVKFVWTHDLYSKDKPLVTRGGETVAVESHGRSDAGEDIIGARIKISDATHHGKIAVAVKSSEFTERASEDHILLVALSDDSPVCHTDGTVLPTVEIIIPDEIVSVYKELSENEDKQLCASYLAGADPVHRYHILTRLEIERLERKYTEFNDLRLENRNSWDEAFYITLFQAMGRSRNKEAYKELARRVSYINVCRIKQSKMAVEALLLGTAGLLWPEEHDMFPDDYTVAMQKEFHHLVNRFEIKPMRRSDWDFSESNPNNHPVIRIAELASLLCTNDFLFDKLIECTTVDQIHRILSATASEYWTTHSLPGKRAGNEVKRIGTDTRNSLAINLVIPMMFAYGNITGREELKERAIELLEKIAPERNRILYDWRGKGVEVSNAFFSQGLLELSKEYCFKNRCSQCHIGKILMTTHG